MGPIDEQEAISIIGLPDPVVVRLVDNVIVDPGDKGIEVSPMQDGVVRGNVVRVQESHDYPIKLTGSGSLIQENIVSVQTDGGYHGIWVANDDCVIVGNISRGARSGLYVSGSGNRIAENELGDSSEPGVIVSGSNNLVENNQIHGNDDYGISFGNGNGHAYRNNMLRGNSLGAIGGSPNTDAGGNII